MAKKLSFRSLVSLVIGSQIGSGVFLLPASLALLGPISLFGWLLSGTGAILLALVFAQLSMRVSKGGGPQVYIEEAFGRRAAFFTAWTYWVVSWVSSIAVIVAAIGYLSPFLGISHPLFTLALECTILISITLVNLRGAATAGSFEILLTLLKCIPLIAIPLVALFFLNPDHFTPLLPAGRELAGSLNSATHMTFWGFVGLETATVSTNLIDNPKKAIPRAILLGTIVVAAIYFLNSFGVMGVVSPEKLSTSRAPYVDAAEALFGGGWNFAIALIAFTACVGTLNAWVLTSGQIAAEASKDGLFPAFFSKTNRQGAPYLSLLLALGCTLPLLALTLQANILKQLSAIIDFSVTIFIFIYLFCAAAFLKILPKKVSLYGGLGLASIGFCLWVLSFITLTNLALCSLFVLSGAPVYLYHRRKKATELLKESEGC